MHPILFSISGFNIYSYGVALALAFLTATIMSTSRARAVGIHPDRVLDLAIVVVLASIVGARVAYVLSEPSVFDGTLKSLLNIRAGGLAFQGGLAGGILGGVIYCRATKTDGWKLAEVVPGPIAIGYAIARLGGCFMNGCCYGVPTDSPLGVVFPNIDSIPRHPTQLYSAFGSLVIFAVLIAVRRHKVFEGFSMFLFVALYAVERFIVEFFRDRPYAISNLSWAQLACIVGFVGSIAAIAVLRSRRGYAVLEGRAQVR